MSKKRISRGKMIFVQRGLQVSQVWVSNIQLYLISNEENNYHSCNHNLINCKLSMKIYSRGSTGVEPISAEQFQPNYDHTWVFITQLGNARQHLLMQRLWVRILLVPGLKKLLFGLKLQ